MLLSRLRGIIPAGSRNRGSRVMQVEGVLSQEAFHALLKHERARADRTNKGFSLIVFGLENAGARASNISKLARLIAIRQRATDEVGWFGDGRLGILLPETTIEGACRLAADIYIIASRKMRVAWQVYVYPSDWFPEEDGNACAGPQTRAPKSPSRPRDTSMDTSKGAMKQSPGELAPLLCSGMPIWKRALDLTLALTALVLLLPLFLVIAIYIKIVAPGPVFFKQKRLGYMGREFTIWKFRTMRTNCNSVSHRQHLERLRKSNSTMIKLDNLSDPRIIPMGRILREFGLDELPQIFNVIRGEMSLIGPRPCISYEAEGYDTWQRQRFDTMPGLSGLWQVTGKNRTTFLQMIQLDARYVRDRSFLLDIKILLKTIPAVIMQAREGLFRRNTLRREVKSYVKNN